MTKRIIHTDVRINENWEHPLNFLASKYVAEVSGEDGSHATGKGDTRAAAVANAAKRLSDD